MKTEVRVGLKFGHCKNGPGHVPGKQLGQAHGELRPCSSLSPSVLRHPPHLRFCFGLRAHNLLEMTCSGNLALARHVSLILVALERADAESAKAPSPLM